MGATEGPRIDYLECPHPGGTHRLAYRLWEPAGAATGTVMCVHGLTRTGGDFDRLAGVLVQAGWRLICPDMPGRGLSERLPAAALYDVPQYADDCRLLIETLECEAIDWIGTSMGGLIGMSLTSKPGHAVRRLLINDIGPVILREGLLRIAGYVGDTTRYASFDEAEAALRVRMQSFGPHTDDEFRWLSRHHFVDTGDGWIAHLDPLIASAFDTPPDDDISFWPVWEKIDCPVTLLRGEESDLLDAATATLMTQGGPNGSGPHARLETFAGVGHAPTLIAPDQIAAVERFLNG